MFSVAQRRNATIDYHIGTDTTISLRPENLRSSLSKNCCHMKKSKITRKCSPKGGLTIAQLVNGYKTSHPRHVVVELQDVKPEVMTFKAFRPIQVPGIGRGMSKVSKFAPVTSSSFEVKSVTKKEAKDLRRQGYQVRLLGPASEFDSTTSVIRAVRGKATVTGTGRLTLFDSAARGAAGIARHRGGAAYSGIGGGGSGFGGFGAGGGGLSVGGGGSGGGTPTSERRFLALILIDIEKQKAILEKEVSEIRKRMRQLPEDHNDEGQEDELEQDGKSVFNKYIDENHMADALFEVYEQYRSNNLFNKDFKPIDLIAYMFVMVDRFGYGRLDFRSNAQKPFFDFFKRKVVPDLEGTRGNTRESMGNRLRGRMRYLYPNTPPKSQLLMSKRLVAEKTEKEYIEVCGNFHKTQYGAILKRQLGK